MGSPRPRPTLQWVSRPTLQWVNTRSTKTKKHLEVSYPLHHRITRCQDVPCHLGINALSIHQHVHNSDTFIVKQLSITCVLAAMILLYYYCTVFILLFMYVQVGSRHCYQMWCGMNNLYQQAVLYPANDLTGPSSPSHWKDQRSQPPKSHGSCWLTRSNHRIWRSWISPCIGL